MSGLHIVTGKENGFRIDKLMVTLQANVSRQQMQRWIKDGVVLVNGVVVKPNYKCQSGDKVSWEVPKKVDIPILPEAVGLPILYEDDDLVVINKPKGMLVHPTHQIKTGTLVNALKHHCTELSDLSGEERPGIVHRLDQDTSGVLVVAKNNRTHAHLKEQFKEQSVERIYEAIVFGVVQHESGRIDAPIGRNPKNRLQRAVVSGGKEAETCFRVLRHFKEHTHVECELKTGRTHQIRVHMKYMNHPIVGDEVYSKKTSFIKGQALFAKRLSFVHPTTNEKMMFAVERPEAFKQLLERLSM
jgi:23S rRNA pseudouridine1911/1915/1917 synthase